MDDLKNELNKKKEMLEKLIKSRSNACCSTVYSSKDDVIRESEIEDLEDEILELEEKINS